MRLFLAALAVWLAPMVAHAQSGGADAICTAAIANRAQYGRLIHFYGDSIARGYGLGVFADQVDPAHPLYAFRSVASMANWALEINGRSERVAYCGGISTTAITARISAGVIQAGDMVVLEDAGDYAAGPNSYYANVMWPARQAAAQSGVTVVMMSMFEYCHDGNMACGTAFQYDTAIGAQGTLNDATRRAALVAANGNASGSVLPGVTRFIDMNWVMDSWRSSALSVDGVDVMLSDGVHPNVWGQMKMAREILGVAGLRSYLANVDPIQDLAEAHYADLAYGSATFTGSRARAYVAANLGAN